VLHEKICGPKQLTLNKNTYALEVIGVFLPLKLKNKKKPVASKQLHVKGKIKYWRKEDISRFI
jgi:hypothetical protein